jgi:hypothetical protein
MNSIRQINAAVSWHIWRGQKFRVPMSTLYKTKEQGGRGLINLVAKCRMLLLFRITDLGKKAQSITARWLGNWGLLHTRTTRPNKNRALDNFEYLQHLEIDSAYISARGMAQSGRAYRTRIYNILANYLQAEANARVMRIENFGLTLIGEGHGRTFG